jgi:hypothetical protein
MQPTRVSALAAAVTLLVGTLATSSAPAVGAPQVSQYVHDDPAGDMFQMSVDPGGVNGDFLRSVVRHRRHAVLVKSSFTDLVPTGTQLTTMSLYTDEHRPGDRTIPWRYASVSWFEGGPPGASLYDPDTSQSVTCDGLSWDVDFEENTWMMRVPRRCLEHPRWIRASLVSDVTESAPSMSWWRDSGFGPGDGQLRNLSPRLFREPASSTS